MTADAAEQASTPAPDGALRAEGPSYPPLVKVIATLLVAALVLWGWRASAAFKLEDLGAGGTGFVAAVLVAIAFGYGTILFSRTAVDGETIRQTWLWTREVRLANVTQVKLIQVPGLAWLIVPRLVVRTRGLGIASFQAGDAQLLDAFRRLAYG